MQSAKIANAIICEDVRVEGNGKHIILGVFSADILVRELPAFIPIMLWLQLDDIGDEPEEYEYRGVMSDAEFVSGNFQLKVSPSPNRATIALGQFPLRIENEGQLKFDVRPAKEGRWKNAISMSVRVTKDIDARR